MLRRVLILGVSKQVATEAEHGTKSFGNIFYLKISFSIFRFFLSPLWGFDPFFGQESKSKEGDDAEKVLRRVLILGVWKQVATEAEHGTKSFGNIFYLKISFSIFRYFIPFISGFDPFFGQESKSKEGDDAAKVLLLFLVVLKKVATEAEHGTKDIKRLILEYLLFENHFHHFQICYPFYRVSAMTWPGVQSQESW